MYLLKSPVLELKVVYISVTTSSPAMSVTSEYIMALYSRIGRRRCSAVSRKTACKFFSKFLMETNVNKSIELNFSGPGCSKHR